MRLRIYLVEDNPVIRENLAESLEELAGARVVGGATTEAEASDWLTAHSASWDLAVVDLFLLQGNGLGVIGRCRNRSLSQKMVVLTNYATPTIRERCLAIGADAVFDKSNELEEFTRYAREEVQRASGETRW
ncbi:MAG: response regulator transcription factor [Pseudomonadota bacterium]